MSKQRIRKRVLKWLKVDVMLEDLFVLRGDLVALAGELKVLKNSTVEVRNGTISAFNDIHSRLSDIEAALAIEAQEGAVKRRPADADPHWGTGA